MQNHICVCWPLEELRSIDVRQGYMYYCQITHTHSQKRATHKHRHVVTNKSKTWMMTGWVLRNGRAITCVCVCVEATKRWDFRGCQEKARALKQLRGSSHFRWATSYTLYCVCTYTPPSRGACFLGFFSPPLLWNDNEKKVAGNGWQSSFLWKKNEGKNVQLVTTAYRSRSLPFSLPFFKIFQKEREEPCCFDLL